MFTGNVRRLATIVTADNQAQSALEDAETAGDDVAESMEGMEDANKDASDSFVDLDVAAAAAGASIAGVGTAAQRTMNQTRGLRESLTITEGTIDDADANLTALATTLSDATFETGEVVRTFEELRQVGVDTEEQMEFLAVELDVIADATGGTADEMASNLIPTLNAYGEDVENVAEMQDTLAFTMNSTQLDARRLNRMLTRQQDEFEEMGLGVEESVQLLGAYQEETGLSGRTLRREFRQDIEQANGDLGRFADEVGMSSNALEEFEDDIPDDFAQELADDVEDTTTLMDELRVVVSDAQLQLSEYLQPVSAVGPALQMAGSAALIYGQVQWSTAIPATRAKAASLWTKITALTASTAAYARNTPTMLANASAAGVLAGAKGVAATAMFGAAGAATALWTALGPIGLAAIGVTAAIMGLVAIMRSDFLGAGDAAAGVLGRLRGGLSRTWELAQGVGAGLKQLARIFLLLGAAVTLGPIALLLRLLTDFEGTTDIAENAVRGFVSTVSDLPSRVLSELPSWQQMMLMAFPPTAATMAGRALVENFASGVVPDPLENAVSDVVGTTRSYLPFSDAKQGPLSDVSATGPALVSTIADGVTDSSGMMDSALSSVLDVGGGVLDGVTGGSDSGGSQSGSELPPIQIDQQFVFEGDVDEDDVAQAASSGTRDVVTELMVELDRKLDSGL